MKERKGFVSNSSSSSFLIIGVEKPGGWGDSKGKEDFVELLVEAEGKHFEGYAGDNYDGDYDYLDFGEDEGEVVTFYGNNSSPYHAGIPALDRLKKDEKVSDLKLEFQKLVKDKLNIDIPLEDINLYFGECSSG